MAHAAAIARFLGGEKVLKRRVSTLDQIREFVLEGLPYDSFDTLTKMLSLGTREAACALTITGRTLVRRRKAKKFSAEESDRIVRLARITARAAEVLGSEEKARGWLRKPNRALGGAIPLFLAATDIGARQVEEVIERIEAGIFS
jgi:putative toxin-antitoxin system antitoxin component (TIGR02293 family)